MEEVQRMKYITQKLLLLSAFDSDRIRLNGVLVDVSKLLEETVDDIAAMAPDLHMDSKIDPGCYAMADEDLIRQVFHNLASNAVKYNRPGGSVAVSLLEADSQLVCRFSNTGTPIAPEDRERIFDRFYSADKARSRKVDGVGLGLSISREIIRLHKGKLNLVSDLSDRVTIQMLLPLNNVNQSE